MMAAAGISTSRNTVPGSSRWNRSPASIRPGSSRADGPALWSGRLRGSMGAMSEGPPPSSSSVSLSCSLMLSQATGLGGSQQWSDSDPWGQLWVLRSDAFSDLGNQRWTQMEGRTLGLGRSSPDQPSLGPHHCFSFPTSRLGLSLPGACSSGPGQPLWPAPACCALLRSWTADPMAWHWGPPLLWSRPPPQLPPHTMTSFHRPWL